MKFKTKIYFSPQINSLSHECRITNKQTNKHKCKGLIVIAKHVLLLIHEKKNESKNIQAKFTFLADSY